MTQYFNLHLLSRSTSSFYHICYYLISSKISMFVKRVLSSSFSVLQRRVSITGKKYYVCMQNGVSFKSQSSSNFFFYKSRPKLYKEVIVYGVSPVEVVILSLLSSGLTTTTSLQQGYQSCRSSPGQKKKKDVLFYISFIQI